MVSLVEKMDRWTLAKGNEPTTAYPALSIYRYQAPTELTNYMLEPSICLIAQGHKRVLLGEDEYLYDQANNYLTTINS
ncbi:MAG: AraC family transcriptional regulator [Proteobacteria bacterium]|nr:AraC family transcriptional regulator [Pseudomonadota bacterium]